jgi:hypothetical protein
MRVTAIDVATGVEATMQGPANLSAAELRGVALKKLAYVIEKRRLK